MLVEDPILHTLKSYKIRELCIFLCLDKVCRLHIEIHLRIFSIFCAMSGMKLKLATFYILFREPQLFEWGRPKFAEIFGCVAWTFGVPSKRLWITRGSLFRLARPFHSTRYAMRLAALVTDNSPLTLATSFLHCTAWDGQRGDQFIDQWSEKLTGTKPYQKRGYSTL